MDFVTRFAPSPTGLLHLGHAFSAWTAHDAARAAGGRFLLRIEDLDQGRCRPAFEAAILEDLAWLGVRWDGAPRRQSEHLPAYAAALDALIAQGVMYRCFRTRREVLEAMAHAPHGPEAPFTGGPLTPDEEAERLRKGESFAWRLSAARAAERVGEIWFEDETGPIKADPRRLGDAVLARKDFPASYHLASVWDDALQGVTHVIRGEDLRDSAHLHVVLQNLLDLPTPLYRHHRLIVDERGKRFAKRDAGVTLRALREAGATPEDLRKTLGL